MGLGAKLLKDPQKKVNDNSMNANSQKLLRARLVELIETPSFSKDEDKTLDLPEAFASEGVVDIENNTIQVFGSKF